jgi:carnitine O-acetyltransferase
MEQYKHLFSATRIPRKERDALRITPSQNHILVLYQGSVFSLNVVEDSGVAKPYAEIKDALAYILSMEQHAHGEGVGILTSLPRDTWTDTREHLLWISPQNKEHIEKIDTAVFALCLDTSAPDRLEDISKLMLHGNGKNRWFDKSLQFIVSKNGEIGINMEHTGMDGSVASRFIKFIYEDIDGMNRSKDKKSKNTPEKLVFQLNDDIKKEIAAASEQFDHIVSNQATRVLVFDRFGTNYIKTFYVSPDAFVQLALQLAQHKLFGRCFSAYEPVMTRQFLHGRIDVMYTISHESIAFIEAMNDVSCDVQVKKSTLIKAAQKHIERIKECQNGMGVNGHLMALLKIYENFGEGMGIASMPEIFTDTGYKRLTHSTICTSTTSPHGLALGGWGPVVEDGFGIRYVKDREEIRFNITSRRYMEENLDKLVSYIQESLMEMAKILIE